MAFALVQLVLLITALVLGARAWRRRRSLDRICRHFIDAVAEGNYPDADRHAGLWFLAATSRRRPPPPPSPPFRWPSFPHGPFP